MDENTLETDENHFYRFRFHILFKIGMESETRIHKQNRILSNTVTLIYRNIKTP